MQTRVPWQNEYTVPDIFIFRYNRVESIFLGVGLENRPYWDGRRSFGAFGSIGYGFASYRWRGNLGLTGQFALAPQKRTQILEFGLDGYSLTDSKDELPSLWTSTIRSPTEPTGHSSGEARPSGTTRQLMNARCEASR